MKKYGIIILILIIVIVNIFFILTSCGEVETNNVSQSNKSDISFIIRNVPSTIAQQ